MPSVVRRLALVLLALGGLIGGLAIAEVAIRVHDALRGPKQKNVGVEDPVRHHRWLASAQANAARRLLCSVASRSSQAA